MQYMQHFYSATRDPIEDEIISIRAPPNTDLLIPRDKRISPRICGETLASLAQLRYESQGARGIIGSDPVTDLLEVCLCSLGNDDDHYALAFAAARYFAFKRRNTCPSGFTRPASASAIPRAMAASSAASRFSR